MKVQVYFKDATATLDNAKALVIDGRYELIMDKGTHELMIREYVKTVQVGRRKSVKEWAPRFIMKIEKQQKETEESFEIRLAKAMGYKEPESKRTCDLDDEH